MIDPHVHCRDGKQSYKATIAQVIALALSQGVDLIFDMPNTDPPIFTSEDVKERLKLVPTKYKKNYYLYVGLTSDAKQIAQAVQAYNQFPQVIGFKLYAGQSTGNLGVVKEESQKKVYEALTKNEYKGVLAVHCEKESLFIPNLWDPKKPITHAKSRPEIAEIESVKDQIAFVKKYGFKGTLHIAHISVPKAVELVDQARKSISITCGVTPHHLLWDESKLNEKEGLLYKMNPPLRPRKSVIQLRTMLDKIDWIETDHAPHTKEEKMGPPYASGYPSLQLYKDLIETYLPQWHVPTQLIASMTHHNILKTFIKLTQ